MIAAPSSAISYIKVRVRCLVDRAKRSTKQRNPCKTVVDHTSTPTIGGQSGSENLLQYRRQELRRTQVAKGGSKEINVDMKRRLSKYRPAFVPNGH